MTNPQTIINDMKNSDTESLNEFINHLKIRLMETELRNYLNKNGDLKYTFSESFPRIIEGWKDGQICHQIKTELGDELTDSAENTDIFTTGDLKIINATTIPFKESSIDKRIYQIFSKI